MPQNHHIDKHRIVISAGNSAAISGISREIQDSKEELYDIVSRVFDKYFPDDRLIEIDKIHLDLGSLPATGFKQEYQRRLVSLLETELNKISQKSGFKEHVSDRPVRVYDRLELLRHYFLKGYEPSLQNEPGFDLNVLVEEYLLSDRERFAAVLASVWESKTGQQRMKHQLQVEVFNKVRALMNGEGSKARTDQNRWALSLRRYFAQGTWSRSVKAPSILQLERIVGGLQRKERKNLFQELSRLTGNTSSRMRMAYVLSLTSLKKGFSDLPDLRQALKELDIIEKELLRISAGPEFLSSPTFRTLWLEYLYKYRNTSSKVHVFHKLLTQVPVDQDKYRTAIVKKLGQLTEAEDLTKELKRADKEKRIHDSQPDTLAGSSTMDIFIRFLEKGLLPQGLHLNEMMSGLLAAHSVLLAKVLRGKWHLYPVRFRLAYQLNVDYPVKLIHLLFGDSNYLIWFEEMFDSDAAVKAKDLSEKARRGIYFAFFEATAAAFHEELEKRQFQELLATSLTRTLPELNEEDTIRVTETQGYTRLGSYILETLSNAETTSESRKYTKALLHELITRGTTSREYGRQFKTTGDWQDFFDSVVNSRDFSLYLFLNEEVHETFWTELVPALDNNHLEKLTLQVATFQKPTVIQVLDELRLLEKELRSEAGVGAFYPLAKDIYVVLLQALTRSRLSMSATQLSNLLYREVFEKLKKERTPAVYQRITRSLMLQSEHPFFKATHPHISRWLVGVAEKEVFEQALSNRNERWTAGVKINYQEKYTTSDLLLYYVERDVLPDWSNLKGTNEINTLADQAIRSFDPRLMSKIGSGRLDVTTIQRLVSLLDADSWHQLLTYFEPTRHAALSQTITGLVDWAQRHRISSSSQEMEIFLRTQLLVFSLAPPSGVHEYDIQQLLRMIARKYEQHYYDLLALISNDATIMTSSSKLLRDVVKKEYSLQRQQRVIRWKEAGVLASAKGNYNTADAILHYLKKRQIPAWSAAKNEKDIAELIRVGLKDDPHEIKEVIYRINHQPKALTAFASLLKIADLEQVLRLLDKDAFAHLQPVLSDLTEFQKQKKVFPDSESEFRHKVMMLALQVVSVGRIPQSDLTLITDLIDGISRHFSITKQNFYSELATWYGQLKSEGFKALVKQSVVRNTGGGEMGRQGILREYQEQYRTSDLIIYYQKTRSFPEWAAIKNKRSLQNLINNGVSVQEMADILISVADDDAAKATFIELLSTKSLDAALQILDAPHFRAYRQITDDLLSSKEVGKLSVEKQQLKHFLNLLLVTELSRPHPHKSSEDFAAYIIEQTAEKLSIEPVELFHLFEKSLKSFKSRPLQKAVKDLRLKRTVINPSESETFSSVIADIDALLYIISHKAIPWWHMRRTKKRASVKAETQRLYKHLLNEHVEELMKAIQKSGREYYYVTVIFKDTSVNEFHRIINTVVPGIAGFVILYTRVLESLSQKDRRLSFAEGTKIYTHIYQYTRSRESGFTASAFVYEISRYIADVLKLDRHHLLGELAKATEVLLKKGEHKFKTLLDVLQTTLHIPVPVSNEEFLDIPQEEEHGETMEENFGDTLMHYLEHGSLPFRTKLKDYKDLIKAFDHKADSGPAELRSVLISALARPIATERLTRHGTGLLVKVTAMLFDARVRDIEDWLFGVTDFMYSGYPRVRRRNFEILAVQVLLKSLSTHQSFKFDPVAMTRLYIESASKDHIPGLKEKLTSLLQAYKPAAKVSTVFLRSLDKAIYEEEKRIPKPKKEKPVEEKPEPLDESLLIHNAGAVILANFLPRYFDMLGMTEKRAFKDKETAARAVHLLQYLVTGMTETPEHELVLNKVLCGLDLAYPIERSIKLTTKEEEISESLLKGVLQNWDKLKSASIEALREGFLIRDGHLSETPHNWELKVETSGRDILLDFLPWSFNTIKLSWMEKSLNVHWRK